MKEDANSSFDFEDSSESKDPELPTTSSGQRRTKTTIKWEAPLPPPGAIKQYEESVPGAGKIIMDRFREEGKHRQEMEKTIINKDFGLQWCGLICTVIVFLAFLGSSIFLLYNDKTWEGIGVGAITMLLLARITSLFRKESKG